MIPTDETCAGACCEYLEIDYDRELWLPKMKALQQYHKEMKNK